MPRSTRRLERIRGVLARRQPDLTVVLENIHDPHNVSAILRSCDAVGVMAVELLYTVEPFPRIGRKSSSSANKWIQRHRHTSVASCYDSLRQQGYRIYATRVEDRSVPLHDLDLTGPVALVFGNEHRGVSDEAAGGADLQFHIPMVGMIQSLNVSVAAAVCLYEAFRQRRARGMYAGARLGEQQLAELAREWADR